MISLKFNCGCGAPLTVDNVVDHVEETGHKVSVTGTVQPDAGSIPVKQFNRAKEELMQVRLNQQLRKEWRDLNDEDVPDLNDEDVPW